MIRSIIKSLYFRLKYGNRISMHLYRNLSHRCKIEIDKKSKINIGKGLLLQDNSWLIAHDGGIIDIKRNVFLNRNTIVCSHEKIQIDDNVSIGPNVCIYDHNHNFDKNGKTKGFKSKEIIISENVWIGANCTILKGSKIGKNSIIGAGCVISGEIPENSIVKNNNSISIEDLR